MCKTFDKYAVFIDIDGTLMGKCDEALGKNLATIQKVRSLGHKVFISTGRSTAYLPEKIGIEKNFDGVISGAGAVARFNNKEFLKQLMPYSMTEKFSRFVLQHNLMGILEGQNNMYHFEIPEGAEAHWIKLDEENFSKIITPDIPIEKFTISGKAPKELDEIMGDECTVLRFPTYVEIIQKTLGKGNALRETLKMLDIPIERSVAIGDSMNDFDMLKAAGISVAMGNAPDKIKEIADIVTKDVDSAGVSDALTRIFNL